MDNIILTNNGGFPFEQDTLDFIQKSYQRPFAALAKLCGDKTIITGVDVNGSLVSSGWISVNDELVLFQAGSINPLTDKVAIVSTPTTVVFEDGVIRDSYFVKVAMAGVVGDFLFSELVKLSSLKNIWRPGDIKETYCTLDYIAANFDADGYGLNAEKGWRRLDKAIPATAGRVAVNLNEADPDFNEPGDLSGAKTHVLTPSQQSKIRFKVKPDDGDDSIGTFRSITGLDINGQIFDLQAGSSPGSLWTNYKEAPLYGDGAAHNNVQPSYAILKLIKL